MKDKKSSSSMDAVSIYNSTREPSDPKDISFAARKISAIEDIKKCAPLFRYIFNSDLRR